MIKMILTFEAQDEESCKVNFEFDPPLCQGEHFEELDKKGRIEHGTASNIAAMVLDAGGPDCGIETINDDDTAEQLKKGQDGT